MQHTLPCSSFCQSGTLSDMLWCAGGVIETSIGTFQRERLARMKSRQQNQGPGPDSTKALNAPLYDATTCLYGRGVVVYRQWWLSGDTVLPGLLVAMDWAYERIKVPYSHCVNFFLS